MNDLVSEFVLLFAGFLVSVKMGTGIVVTRLGDSLDSWSAPCAIGTAGISLSLVAD